MNKKTDRINKLNILVIGTGMYVSGRGTDGYGTILPAISEYQRRNGAIRNIFLAGTNGDRAKQAKLKASRLLDLTGISLSLEFHPQESIEDPQAYKKILETMESPACAIVAVPDHLHYEIVKDCLNAGLHTLVVKPLTPTLSEARKLVTLAKKQNLYGAVEFHKRWDRQNLMLRDVFKTGKIGDPLYTWTEYSQRKSIPTEKFRSWAEKTNILQYLGVHYVDIIRFITGAIPIRVMALGQKNWLKSQGLDIHDAIQCMVEWKMENGKLFNQTLLTNWIDPESTSAMSDQKLKVVGTRGRFEANQKERGIRLIVDGKTLEEPNPDFCQPYKIKNGETQWQGYGIESIVTFFEDVTHIINGQELPEYFENKRPTFNEATISTAVIEAAGKSLTQDGMWITIDHSYLK